ncbi:DUF1223 domain-containing protein [Acuticoccus sediminis]|uniref:DUF1223 domain-containing protein n=1 Tax=Acuticoccus sediminis TaxID=2184697 RepID=A0A8B2NMQ1_9HYPH|nr:DUF1223 domain-containing protein [Acuticoccus sediminis]RAH99448.1 DUF1223 domain-containing protein [Acuticoccus sediminis]
MQRVPYRKQATYFLSTLVSALVLLGIATLTARAEEKSPKAVLELFTSQGCSSCPSADKLIAQYARRDDVLAMTLPVKLWDYLGWSDTLATEINTKRQMAYSVARGDRDVYTPQLVINGETAMLGSDKDAIDQEVATSDLPLPIDLSLNNGVLEIDLGDAEIDAESATIWLMVLDDRVHVPVSAGENRGRKLDYYNVVRDMRPVGIWKGQPIKLELPLSDVEKHATSGCVVIAQVDTFKGPGRIVGAAQLHQIFPARTIGSADGSFPYKPGIR